MSLSGDGPAANWRGRFEASAGAVAKVGADLKVAARAETAVAINGVAEVTRLLPPEFMPLLGERLPIELHLTARENGAIAVDDLTVALASGTATGAALFATPDRKIAGQLRVSLPDLAVVKGALGVQGRGRR